MPEGHVIHRLASSLNREFAGQETVVSSPQGRFATEADQLNHTVLKHAEAHGKHLFIGFEANQAAHIVYIHLGLIGSLRISDLAEPRGQVRLRIASDSRAADLRGPQWCRLITDEEKDAAIGKLGADPLDPHADPSRSFQRIKRSSKPISTLLMDQHIFAGVGNIYRAETLFRLGLNPELRGKDLTDDDLHAIWDDLVETMTMGFRVGKIDTVRPEHMPEAMGREPRVDAHGGEVYVYRRAGLPCYVCGTTIVERKVNGRHLFWCPMCQA